MVGVELKSRISCWLRDDGNAFKWNMFFFKGLLKGFHLLGELAGLSVRLPWRGRYLVWSRNGGGGFEGSLIMWMKARDSLLLQLFIRIKNHFSVERLPGLKKEHFIQYRQRHGEEPPLQNWKSKAKPETRKDRRAAEKNRMPRTAQNYNIAPSEGKAEGF